jgi:hypothetical protein
VQEEENGKDRSRIRGITLINSMLKNRGLELPASRLCCRALTVALPFSLINPTSLKKKK